jgi:predicted amidohydrolase YtcJ
VRTLYLNAVVYSTAVRDATALLVDGDSIGWIGDEPAAHPGVPTVDVAGALIAPAFVDAHVHVTSTGLALTGLDLSGAQSLADALDRVERHARDGRGRPVLGSGWDETGWPERRPPTARELDRAGYGGLVYLSRVDAHSAVVSSTLLAATPQARSLPGFRADGWLARDAHDAVRPVAFAALTPAARRAAQRATRRRAAELGIGCLQEMAGPEISSGADLAGLLDLAREEPGPEVIGYWGELFGVDAARDLGAAGAAGDLFCDGSLGSHTAALNQPYADLPDEAGELRFTVDDLAEHLRRCEQAGLQGGFHAIGDAAVDAVLAATESIRGSGRSIGAGHRLEHAEMVDDPARLAAAGLTASVQPVFDATWGGPHGMYAARLGPERAAAMNRFGELAAAGVPLAFGSDAPVTSLGPWEAVRAAIYPAGPKPGLSPRAAFLAHTRGGWRAARADADGSGQLAPGAPATFAVWRIGDLAVAPANDRISRWSTDPRAAVPSLPDLRPGQDLPTCLRTVVRGQVVFDASSTCP